MKQYTKIYLDHFGYDVSDFVPCEVCQSRAVDTHHIFSRKIGGTIMPDHVENLQALCREHHIQYGDKKEWLGWLLRVHRNRLIQHGKPFDLEWIDEQLKKCS